MRRTTVKLTDDIDAKLRHEAARRGNTIKEVIREAIEAHVGSIAGRRLIAAKRNEAGVATRRGASSDHPARGSPTTLIVDSGMWLAV